MFFYFKICLFCALAAVLYALLLYLLQRCLIFVPSHRYISPAKMKNSPFTENPLVMQDKTTVMTWYAKKDIQKPAILFFHGNALQLSAYAEQLYPFIEQGYSVLMMEYRNFGSTKGKTVQKDIFSDAAETFDWLKKQGYPEIIVYGYSYGTAVACGLTAMRKANKLILTAPFSSLLQLVKEKPVPLAGWLLKDHYLSDLYIKKYHNPLLLIHGTKDRLIPHKHSRNLYDAAASEDKTLVLIDGVSHKPLYFEKLNHKAIFDWLKKY